MYNRAWNEHLQAKKPTRIWFTPRGRSSVDVIYKLKVPSRGFRMDLRKDSQGD